MERGQAGPALFLHSAPANESKFPYGTKLGLALQLRFLFEMGAARLGLVSPPPL